MIFAIRIKLIHIIYSKPRHQKNNGIVERLHKEIKKTLFKEKLLKKIIIILKWLYQMLHMLIIKQYQKLQI